MATDSETFNPHQQRRLRVTCQHIDGLLSEIETILSAAGSKSPFPKYLDDVGTTRRKRMEHGIAHLRAQLVRVLERQGIAVEPPSISARHAIHSALTFAQIAAEELGPKHMRGYGEVSRRAASELDGIVSGLLEQIAELDGFGDDK
jgi:hypothetical protein